MSRSLLQLVLRQAEGLVSDPADSDAELLRRFLRTREESAFAEMLRRHGPMVWAVCRHLLVNESDAEDAFQATFLALVRSANTVRNGDALAGWLHGVAVKVATKVKRTAARRRHYEERVAEPEADRSIPEATWDALLAAVHEEVQRLPGSLRTAFILCELEGVRQPEAAARLGWKPGTLTGRLTRARQILLARLSSRGLAPSLAGGTLGLGVATASATVPTTLSDKSLMLLNASEAVSPAILNLAREVIPMMAMRTKLAAAALVLAGGFGAVLFPMANAQQPGGSGGGGPPPGVGAPGPGGPGPQAPPGVGSRPVAEMTPARTVWEYKFLTDGLSGDYSKRFAELGNDGWEYCNSVPTQNREPTLIFKRMKSVPVHGGSPGGPGGGPGSPPGTGFSPSGPPGGAPGGGGGGPAGASGARLGVRLESGSGAGPSLGGGGAGGNPVTILTLKNASAADLSVLIERVYPILTVAVDTRTNSLILRTDVQTLKAVTVLVEQLDVPGNTGEGP